MNKSDAVDLLWEANESLQALLSSLGVPFNQPPEANNHDDKREGYNPYWLSVNYYASNDHGVVRMTGYLHNMTLTGRIAFVKTLHALFPAANVSMKGLSFNCDLMKFNYTPDGAIRVI